MSSHVFKDRNDFPTEEEMELASASCREIAAHFPKKKGKSVKITLTIEKKNVELEIPLSSLQILMKSLIETAKGNVIALVPIHSELSSQEAADLLNISRPFFIKLLDQGKIPFHKTGTHRRVLFKDVMAFKKEFDTESEKAMDELVKQAQELDLGY